MRIIHGQEVEIEPTPTFTVSKHMVSANVPHRSVCNVCVNLGQGCLPIP